MAEQQKENDQKSKVCGRLDKLELVVVRLETVITQLCDVIVGRFPVATVSKLSYLTISFIDFNGISTEFFQRVASNDPRPRPPQAVEMEEPARKRARKYVKFAEQRSEHFPEPLPVEPPKSIDSDVSSLPPGQSSLPSVAPPKSVHESFSE